MPLKISSICLVLMLLMTTTTLEAQKKTRKKDPKKETEQVEAPPVVERLEATPDEPVDLSQIEEPKLDLDTTAAPNDELTAAIKDLMQLTGAMELGKMMGRNLMKLDEQTRAGMPKEFFDRMHKVFEREDVNRWMINGVVKVYREKFTLEEIKAITEFYKTPVGKKAISLMPEIAQASMKIGEQIGRYVGVKIFKELVDEGAFK